MSRVKEYKVAEWPKLLDHAYIATEEWVRPANMDAYLQQMVLVFYPLTEGKREAMAEQCGATIAVTGRELRMAKLKLPSPAMFKEKQEQAKLALRDFLGVQSGLDRGVLRKPKRLAYRDAFKWPYQGSDFGDPAECTKCSGPTEFAWKVRRGDWTVRCGHCGWKKVFRKTWIDKQYMNDKKEADRANAKVRPYASSEDTNYFYMKLKALYVPTDPHDAPLQVVVK